MSKIAEIPYDEAEWVWVADFYDIKLGGLLRHRGQLCEFRTDYETGVVSVYRLGMLRKLWWLLQKKLWEWRWGYDNTYPQREAPND